MGCLVHGTRCAVDFHPALCIRLFLQILCKTFHNAEVPECMHDSTFGAVLSGVVLRRICTSSSSDPVFNKTDHACTVIRMAKDKV